MDGSTRQLRPRHDLSDRPWAVRGPIYLRHHREGRREVWYAEDADGVVALAESREELERALAEQGQQAEPPS